MHFIQHCFICRPSDSAVSEDSEIEPRTVATLASTYKTIRKELIKEELKHSFLKLILSNMSRDDFQSSPIQLTIEMYSTYSVLVGQINLFEFFYLNC